MKIEAKEFISIDFEEYVSNTNGGQELRIRNNLIKSCMQGLI